MLDFIKEELEKNAENKCREFNKKLCPDTQKEILGVKIPVLRKLAKKIIASNPEEYLKNAPNDYLEEIVLEGLVIASLKIDIASKLEKLKKYIPKIDSWVITDTVCPTIKPKSSELDIVWDFISPYAKSQKEFEIRFAVIMMLDYFLTDEYVDQVIMTLDTIKTDKYYAEMAIAWCLAEIGICYNQKAMAYLKGKHHLSEFTYNKTLQKMIESYRITEEQKVLLRKMKKRELNNRK